MCLLSKVIIAISLISFVVFIIFFGRLPALRKTPIGALYRLIWIHFPSALRSLDQRVTDGRIYASTAHCFRYMMTKRHPTVLVFFVLLLFIPEAMSLPRILPTLSLSMQLLTIPIVLCPYIFLVLASYVDPGYITRENVDFYGSLYPYDHTLYVPDQVCTTCRLPKPPRSKHCSLCGHCIARLDHHCIFINGCVGYGNHHWFLLLLFSTAILTTAGTWLGGGYCLDRIQTVYPEFSLFGFGLTWSDYFAFWSWAIATDPYIGSIALLCLLTTPLVWILLLYNLYLMYRGMTTNETAKWSDFQLDIADGYVYRRSLSRDRKQDLRSEPTVRGWPKTADHVYLRAYQDPPDLPSNIPGDGTWTRDFTLRDVENVYDMGFMASMLDVLLPRKYLMAYLGLDIDSER